MKFFGNTPGRVLKGIHGVLKAIVLLPIRGYRRFLSPMKGTATCRFTPTCSAYAMEAVEEWGIVVGLVLAFWRIVRCNPFSAGGYDPVPKKSDVFAPRK